MSFASVEFPPMSNVVEWPSKFGIGFNKIALICVLGFLIPTILFALAAKGKGGKLVPRGIQNFVEGIIEFVEVLKLDVAFLYDLLGATQEHKIKPKKFPQTDIDEVIIGHTNEAEYQRLLSNEYMEALRDRTIKIDVPYITKLSQEVKIYRKDFGQSSDRVRGIHVAPHTLEVAAMWATLTRLEDPKKHQLSLLQKLKLYDGRNLPGFTQDNVKELRKEASREGLDGISPRYVQDKISNALVRDGVEGYINPFMVLNELEKGLEGHSLLSNEEQRKRFRDRQKQVELARQRQVPHVGAPPPERQRRSQ